MPPKLDPYKSPGMKLITLLFRFLYTDQPQALIDLARHLNCSKQTVMRQIDYLQRALRLEFETSFEGRRKFYRMKHQTHKQHVVSVTADELAVLEMCSVFTRHLIGKKLFDEAARALGKNWISLPAGKRISTGHFADYLPGTIDYTPFYEIIRTLIQAMNQSKICEISYRGIMEARLKTFYIKPYKLFSHKDTLYLHAGWAKYPGDKYIEPDFDPLLPVHRIQTLELTERNFVFPSKYDFEKVFNTSFGVIKGKSFPVEIEFSGWAARFVQERNWSPDQKIIKRKDGLIRLQFSASSEPELSSWVLSFKSEAKVIKPGWLVDQVRNEVAGIQAIYA
jgi:predicted DNA-binding transcriptional regulator YafY